MPSPKIFSPCLGLTILLTFVGRSALAGPAPFFIAVEPGLANLAGLETQPESRYGFLGGLSMGLRISSLMQLQASVDLKRFKANWVMAASVGTGWHLDAGPLSPYVEVGVGVIMVPRGYVPAGVPFYSLSPVIGLGADFYPQSSPFFAGVIVRYFAGFGSSLMQPAYRQFALRLGVRLPE